ncbi:MFS transporter [Parachitinimonas caeni]|uniref:MFS transporter n=1 Tax=Parachitinimonas caeni TaxID=3031301 RepID=A0ABT7DY04_9NEIS|nr:MFS transporter [Parachitinimonas caeni]MDK2124045.1 MFS transporter [Parachitinimonas caeni]
MPNLIDAVFLINSASAIMSPLELRASAGLAGLYALRMLGMFLILPVFAIYASQLPGGDNHSLVGIALGAYGLTQALFQLPFGMLSDRIGRKRVIYIGLLLLAIGSAVCALAPNIQWIIIGRSLQGAGAISAALMALLADLTREEIRTMAMAMVGASIGVTFAVSLVIAPALIEWIGLPGVFALTGALAIAGMIGVWQIIPKPALSRFHSDTEANISKLPQSLRHPQLARLNYGIFALHAAQMAMFVTMPLALQHTGHLPVAKHWQVYLPVVVLGFLCMIPAVIYGEKKHQLKRVFVAAVALMLIAQLGMAFALHSFWQIVLFLAIYFIAFNVLEATLPSLISKIAPADARGTAIGVYNTAQSLGIFIGASAGGWLYHYAGTSAVFVFCVVLMSIWLWVAMGMRPPEPVRTKLFHIGESWAGDARLLSAQLGSVRGVREAVVILDERVAYLKVSQDGWDEAAASALIATTEAATSSSSPTP